jgi:V-type H+-transporting ATPase subunit H
LIPLLTEQAKHAAKEKVTRVIMATLKVSLQDPGFFQHNPILNTVFSQNLLLIAPEVNVPSMIAAKLLTLVTSLSTRKWSDDDVIEDIGLLKSELKDRLEGLT